jgi:hypothetical protein
MAGCVQLKAYSTPAQWLLDAVSMDSMSNVSDIYWAFYLINRWAVAIDIGSNVLELLHRRPVVSPLILLLGAQSIVRSSRKSRWWRRRWLPVRTII